MEQANPFTSVDEPAILGPGTLDVALPLVEALRIRHGRSVSLLTKGFGEGVGEGQEEAGYDVLSIEYTPNAERRRRPHVLVPRP